MAYTALFIPNLILLNQLNHVSYQIKKSHRISKHSASCSHNSPMHAIRLTLNLPFFLPILPQAQKKQVVMIA